MNEEITGECQEPDCILDATKNWKGRNVCANCYQKYVRKWEKIRMDSD